MIITPLWHTQFLLDIAGTDVENVSILVDTWLSDYCIGDMMERSTYLDIDIDALRNVDIIYISHAHTDHLDPYILTRIYAPGASTYPLLVLPFTLLYLRPLFAHYIPAACMYFLANRETYTHRGVHITGYMLEQNDITNEDDVMMIGIDNDVEMFFAEIDTVLPEDDEDIQKSLYHILTAKKYETVCYIASRNELEGYMRVIDAPPDRRVHTREQYIRERKEEMRFAYEKYEYEEYMDYPDIYSIPGFCRGYVGQGLVYPYILSPDLHSTRCFPLAEIASLENDLAKGCDKIFPQKALLPGRQYIAQHGDIVAGRKVCSIGQIHTSLQPSSTKADFQPKREGESYTENTFETVGSETSNTVHTPSLLRTYATRPLCPRVYTDTDMHTAMGRLQHILDAVFLPYWGASSTASLRSALLHSPTGTYSIACIVHTTEHIEPQTLVYTYSPAHTGFVYNSTKPHPSPLHTGREGNIDKVHIDETYFLSDILDFLDGKQDLYSNFWHTLDPKKVYRLWTCLGANYVNNTRVYAKYDIHFARAARGETANGYVEGIIHRLM